MLYSSSRLNNQICYKKKNKYSRHFVDERNYRAPGSQINSHTTLQNAAQIFKEPETAPNVTESKKSFPNSWIFWSNTLIKKTEQGEKEGWKKKKKKKEKRMNEARIPHLDFQKISQDRKNPQNNKAKETPRMFFQLETRCKTVHFVLPSLLHILLIKNSCYLLFQFEHISST